MAEPKNQQYNIPLQGQLLNTSSYEFDTKPFAGFNKLEGTYVQGCLSPLYERWEGRSEKVILVNKDNEVFTSNGRQINKGLSSVHKFTGTKKLIKAETANVNEDTIWVGQFNSTDETSYCTIRIEWDGLNLIVKKNSSTVITIQDYETNGASQSITLGSNSGHTKRFILINDNLCIEVDRNTLNVSTAFYENKEATPTNDTFIYNRGNYFLFKDSSSNWRLYDKTTDTFTTYNKDVKLSSSDEGLPCKYYSIIDKYIVLSQDIDEYSYTKTGSYNFDLVIAGTISNIDQNGITLDSANLKHDRTTISGSLSGRTFNIYVSSTVNYIKGVGVSGKANYSFFEINGNKIVNATTSQIPFQWRYLNDGNNPSFESVNSGMFSPDFDFVDGLQIPVNLNGSFNYNPFYILYNNGVVSNVSYKSHFWKESGGGTENLTYITQGLIVENWNNIDETFPITSIYSPAADSYALTYKTYDGKIMSIATINVSQSATFENKVFLNRYVVSPLIDNPLNCYDTLTGKVMSFGADWNNYLYSYHNENLGGKTIFNTDLIGKVFSKNYVKEAEDKLEDYISLAGYIGSAINEQYPLTGVNVCSTIRNPKPIFTYTNFTLPKTLRGTFVSGGTQDNFVNVYFDKTAAPKYQYSYNYNRVANTNLNDTTFPTDTNGNILLNICPLVEPFDESFLLYTNFKLNDKQYAQLATINGSNLLNYYFGTVSTDVDEVFMMAGQAYAIRNNIIYLSSISNGVINTETPIVNKGDMKLLGTLPLAALFYSSLNKKIYSFTGDTNLTEFLDVSRYGEPEEVRSNLTTQEIYLGYDKKFLVISANGINEVPFRYKKVFFTKDYIVFYEEFQIPNSNDTVPYLHWSSYYKVDDEQKPVPLKVNTCYYGLQNNIVSTNDCIYLRLYNPNKEDGYITLRAVTLMNGIKETDEKTQTIKYEQFDKASDTFYLRFQPALQKATSESVEIETTFSIGSLIFSNQPETTLIGTTGNGNKNSHNF